MPSPPPRHVHEPAPEALAFRFQDGTSARSLAEFAQRLQAATPSTVWYHRDHFAPWLSDVVLDEPLARRVAYFAESAPDPEVFREIVLDLVAKRLS